jgi:hypothetical protein
LKNAYDGIKYKTEMKVKKNYRFLLGGEVFHALGNGVSPAEKESGVENALQMT